MCSRGSSALAELLVISCFLFNNLFGKVIPVFPKWIPLAFLLLSCCMKLWLYLADLLVTTIFYFMFSSKCLPELCAFCFIFTFAVVILVLVLALLVLTTRLKICQCNLCGWCLCLFIFVLLCTYVTVNVNYVVDAAWHVFRVSSVLNHDNKQFGKSYMFDGKEDTCWNSDEVWSVLLYWRNIIHCKY